MSGLSLRQAERWHNKLLEDPDRVRFLLEERGVVQDTLVEIWLGWDGQRYTIPVLDEDNKLVNVRRYKPGATNTKVLSVASHGSPIRLYMPFALKDDEDVVLAEGELDAIKTGQELAAAGLPIGVVSGTGGAGSIPPTERLEPLRERRVFIAYDCDDTGRRGAHKLAAALTGIARAVHVVDLGLGDEGEDLTDWFVRFGKTANELVELLESTPAWSVELQRPRRAAEETNQPRSWKGAVGRRAQRNRPVAGVLALSV